MALQGTLKDFSITEIIQLIGQQLKTGVLKIHNGKNSVEVSFVDGMIVHVYSNYRGKKDLIGEILVKAQLITEEQLERVLRIQKETLKYLGEILVDLHLLTKEDVLKVISTQIYETIYDLFWWEDGTFNFDLKLVESYQRIPFALSTEQVLLNILRMVDEWSEIEKKIASPFLVFRKTTGGEEKGPLSPQQYLLEKLTSEQELVFNLVDGTRTVQDIIDRSLLGKFNASEILMNLLETGLIERVGIQTPSLTKRVKMLPVKASLNYLCYGVVLVTLFCLLVYIKPGFLNLILESRIQVPGMEAPLHYRHKIQLHRVKQALEVYRLQKGDYPNRLEDMVTVGLLKKTDLHYQKGISYKYEVKDGTYFLRH